MKQVNKNLYIFHYPLYNFNCSVIKTDDFIFVIDTYLGPDGIKEVKEFVEKNKEHRKVYVINTHSHYDHIWGNCLFENCQIISHRLCREKILSDGEKVLKEFKEKEPKLILGDIKIKAPDIIFEDELTFFSKDISIKLKHFKGHTKDGIIIIIEPYHICIAGDLVEEPFPIVNEEDSNLKEFISSLEEMDKMEFNLVIPSHGNRFDKGLIKENIYYLKQLESKSISEDYCMQNNITSEFYLKAHEENLDQVSVDY